MRPEEGRRTLLSMLFYFFFVAHVVMVKSAANALFLSRHEPKNLPYLYILMAVIVAVIVCSFSNYLADPRRRLMRLFSLLGTAATLVVCWALLEFDLLPASPFLYLFGEIAATALNIQFWSVAGDIFDPQEGKRVFGILAGGGMAGSIFGGLFVHQAGPLLGTVTLLLTAAGSLLLCVVCAVGLAKHQGRADLLKECKAPSLQSTFRYVLGQPYPRAFALLMLLASVLTAFVDYFFRTSARTFLQEDQLAVLFGDLNVYVGVLSVTFLLVFSGRILRRVGIFHYLMIVPMGMLLVSGGSIFYQQFLLVYALKIIENAGSLSINQAGLQLLYNPVPTILRTSTRGIVDGFFRKMGFAVGGLLILLCAPLLGPIAFRVIVMVMVILFCGLLLFLRRRYISTLDEKIRGGTSEPANLRLEDASTRLLLVQCLDSSNEERVHMALGVLSSIPDVEIRLPLEKLIKSQSERIQLAAIEAVAGRGYKEFLFDLLAIINTGARRTRVAAIRAVTSLDPVRAGGVLAPYLRADDPGLVTASVEALIQVQGYSPDNPAIPVLEGLLDQGHRALPSVRRETARLLGRLREGPYSDRLIVYLSDPDPSVRRLAAQSAQQFFREDYVPLLLHMLSERETRKDARSALAAYGDHIMDVLEAWLNDRDRPLGVRLRLPRLLRMIATQRAGEVLLFSNIQDDAALRYRIALALSGIRLLHPEFRFDRKWALQAVERRLESYQYYAGIYSQLARMLSSRFLVIRALRDRLAQNIEVILRVLGLIYPYRAIMGIHHRFKSATRENWTDALELLDNVIDREVRDRLFPILENHPALLATSPAMPWNATLPQIKAALEELSSSRDLLLRASAIHARCLMGEAIKDQFPELVQGVATVNMMEKVLFLESADIFKQNNLDDLTALAAIAKEKSFSAGQPILVEGEPGDALFIVTKGTVDIVKKNRCLLTVGEKASLGGVSLLDQKPHAASAIAAQDCETLEIDRTDFMDLVSDRVELLHGIFLALTDRLRAFLAVTEEGGFVEKSKNESTNPV